jgi:hypothetical protein
MTTKIKASNIDNNAVTADKLHTTAVTDKLGFTPVTPTELSNAVTAAQSYADTAIANNVDFTGYATESYVNTAITNNVDFTGYATESYVDTAVGTKATLIKSATEPADATAGLLWYNTSNATLYSANGTQYLKVSSAIPSLTSISGDIVKATSGSLTLSGINFLYPNNLVVTFTAGGTEYTATGTTTSDTEATVPVPANVYNGNIGDSVVIKVTNSDNASSGTASKSIQGRPVVLSSVSGDIYNGVGSTLTITGSGFSSSGPITVYFNGGNSVTASVTNDTTATVTVPSAIYNQGAGTSFDIELTNVDNVTASNSISKSVVALPSGGTITTSGNNRIHTFTSSGTFNSTLPLNARVLVVAGGGTAANRHGGGGGAGGMIDNPSVSVSTGSYAIIVGAGGAGGQGGGVPPSGNNSTALGLTAIGGGAGYWSGQSRSGGSGGGAAYQGASPGSGTSGQGNRGGYSNGDAGGGGGGAGAVGGNAPSSSRVGAGGAGRASDISGSSVYYAGGGAGAGRGDHSTNSGGIGGGGSAWGQSGSANTGGGGGGNADTGSGGGGGSGIVIISYQL